MTLREDALMPTVFIRRNTDGVIRTCEDSTEWDGDFIWSEGNYACDCNRALFFARAAGEDDPDRSCGGEAFSVRITDGNGTVLYEDGDWARYETHETRSLD